MDTTERESKSPVRKLIAFFQKSRDGWKATQQASQVSLKKERNQVRAVEQSRANLEGSGRGSGAAGCESGGGNRGAKKKVHPTTWGDSDMPDDIGIYKGMAPMSE